MSTRLRNTGPDGRYRNLGALAILATLALALFTGAGALRLHAEEARVIPAPVTDETAKSTPEVVVLAGGCFWGVQGVFQHVRGVTSVQSGYAGGERETAQYERISGGDTGHAESVRIQFDPRQISLGRILQIYFSVAHDPTELNRQGPDSGTQYRSAIFAQNPEQVAISKTYIAQLNTTRAFNSGIVTRIEPNKHFYEAESYHQDFLTRNPENPYIVINDLPKVANLQRLFPDLYRADPVLVYPPRH